MGKELTLIAAQAKTDDTEEKVHRGVIGGVEGGAQVTEGQEGDTDQDRTLPADSAGKGADGDIADDRRHGRKPSGSWRNRRFPGPIHGSHSGRRRW